MSSRSFAATRDLLERALEVSADQRDAFLDRECGGDNSWRSEVGALLAAAEAPEAFFDRPAVALGSVPASDLAVDEPLPESIGPFRVLSLLGVGGMGHVYLGERAEASFRQRVALKIVKRGMDSAAVLRRFRAEREILARLDHPFIARLIDGGSTADGLPYFALEFVEGQSIDRYCERGRLDVAARIALFLDACEAVQYAHRHLVVHRDLKPSNILVDSEGRVRLLDFGIAKLVDPVTESPAEVGASGPVGAPNDSPTVFERPMTPEFASPEQARGEAVTTASDVYSLGVVLHLLLTGQMPYALSGRDPATIARTVSEVEPTPASVAATRRTDLPPDASRRLARQLAGDVDVILKRALAKDPGRRYSSVEAFADDLRRHLRREPIAARRDSTGYRVRRFVSRHRAATALAVTALLGLLAGAALALWQAREAGRARESAERRFQDVRRLANTFLFDFYDAILELPGSLPARELVLERAEQYLASLAAEAGDDPDLLRELAEAYKRIGDVQGMPYWSSAGKSEQALASYDRALALRDRLSRLRPETPQEALDRSELLSHVGSVKGARGELREALELHRAALQVALELAASDDRAAGQVLVERVAVGDDLSELGDHAGAAVEYEKALAGAHARRDAGLGAGIVERQIGVISQRLGDAYDTLGRRAEALIQFRESLAIDERLLAGDPTNAERRRDLAISAIRIGNGELAAGRVEEAAAEFSRALELRQELHRASPADARSTDDLVEVLRLLAATRSRAEIGKAESEIAEALELAGSLVRADPSSSRYRHALALATEGAVAIAELGGHTADAQRLLREALIQREALYRDSPDHAENAKLLEVLRRRLR